MSFTLWFTGLPGSGKTTIAKGLKQKLHDAGQYIELIESDLMAEYFTGLIPIDKNGRQIVVSAMAVCAEHLNKNTIPVIATSTTPLNKDRAHIRSVISSFFLVYCHASEKTVRQRDPKGLYGLADNGLLMDFPGPGGVYEHPHDADIELNTDKYDPNRCVDDVMAFLHQRGLMQK
ncbi:MAG: adenylyl-sulfate kinase [Proteobacteria bacterium]|nr:adenylyl-sulfate kinase [Pseudomonadota bacterium]